MMKVLLLCAAFLLYASLIHADASLTFTDGAATRVDCGNGASITNLSTFTYLTWFRPTALAGAVRVLIDKGTNGTTGNKSFRFNAANQLRMFINAPVDVTCASNLKAGAWYFVVTTADPSDSQTARIFIGSTTVNVVECSTYTGVSNSSAQFGTDSSSALLIANTSLDSNSFPGQIGWVGVWNRHLSINEIKDQQWSPHVSTGCVLFIYPGWQPAASSQRDLSGNGNNGTVTTATGSLLGPPITLQGGQR